MLINWTKKNFQFLCRINSFQNQNTNLIINDTCLFNSNMRTETYLNQTRYLLCVSPNVLMQ